MKLAMLNTKMYETCASKPRYPEVEKSLNPESIAKLPFLTLHMSHRKIIAICCTLQRALKLPSISRSHLGALSPLELVISDFMATTRIEEFGGT
jgi:hypothetical protein